MSGRLLTLREVENHVGGRLSALDGFGLRVRAMTNDFSEKEYTRAVTRSQLASLVLMSPAYPGGTQCVTEAEMQHWAATKVSLSRIYETDDGNNFGDSSQYVTLSADGSNDFVVPGGYTLYLGYFRVMPGVIRWVGSWYYDFYLLTGTGFTYVQGVTGGANGGTWVRSPDAPLWKYGPGETVRMFVRYNNVNSDASYVEAQGWLVRNA